MGKEPDGDGGIFNLTGADLTNQSRCSREKNYERILIKHKRLAV